MKNKSPSIKMELRRAATWTALASFITIVIVLTCSASIMFKAYQDVIVERFVSAFSGYGVDAEIFFRNFPKLDDVRIFPPFVFVVALFGVITFFTSRVATSFVIRKITKPLDELTRAANRVAAGDLHYHIQYDAQNEIGDVCGAFTNMQEKLRGSLEENRARERVQKELLAGISHDLRTPLTAITGYVKGLRDGTANTPEKQAQYLDTVLAKTRDMGNLAERLFLYAKLDAGSEVFKFEAIPADEYVGGFLDVVRPDMAQKGLEVAYKPAKTDVSVNIDTDQFYRVFTNILENCAKYGASVVTVKTRQSGGDFMLELADNGGGVPSDALPKLFDAFYRADPSRADAASGSGLGLSIAAKIVEAHGGSISAENGENGGLAITITLPIEGADV